MKIVGIIQARMGSTRLPGKMMMTILGKPVIQQVFERVDASKLINELWLATTTNSEDDIISQWADQHGVFCFRGSSEDVLDRYYQANQIANADILVRVTGDCPLIDVVVIDAAIQYYCEGSYDYVSNSQPPTYPDGLDVEVFSAKTLARAWAEATLTSEREHVTPYIWKHPELFRLGTVFCADDLSDHRWTLDTQADFDFINKVMEACAVKQNRCGMSDVLLILKEHPEWATINSQYKRNEGYTKSLKSGKEASSL